VALISLSCADVPLSNYSLTSPSSRGPWTCRSAADCGNSRNDGSHPSVNSRLSRCSYTVAVWLIFMFPAVSSTTDQPTLSNSLGFTVVRFTKSHATTSVSVHEHICPIPPKNLVHLPPLFVAASHSTAF